MLTSKLLQNYNDQDSVVLHKNTHIDQSKSTEINPYIYGQMVFDNGTKIIHGGKKKSFQQIVPGQTQCEILM